MSHRTCPGCGEQNHCQAESDGCWCRDVAPGRVSPTTVDACVCRACLTRTSEAPVEVFDETGALSRDYLLSRGTCCGNGCRNCPY